MWLVLPFFIWSCVWGVAWLVTNHHRKDKAANLNRMGFKMNPKLFRPDGHMMRRKWLAAFVGLIIGAGGCGLAANILLQRLPVSLVVWLLVFTPIIFLAMAVEEWIDPPDGNR